MVADNKKDSAGEDADVSMEDILQSIRRIIADEDDGTPKPTVEAAEPVASGSDVLELTDMMEMVEEAAAPVAAATAPEAFAPDVLQKIDAALTPEQTPPQVQAPEAPAARVEPAPVAPVKETPMPVMDRSAEESLLSSQTAEAVNTTIHKLDEALIPPAPQIQSPRFDSGQSVEGMVMQMLRPMMKAWLDANLPVIVERIVEREVRKLIR